MNSNRRKRMDPASALLTRREMLALGMAAAGVTVCVPNWALARETSRPQSLTRLGPLEGPDENRLLLPAGFRSRIVARSGAAPVADKAHRWHAAPDGGALFKAPNGGWIYVSNSEVPASGGGVSALRFNSKGEIVDCYPILSGTTLNCAGGPTPWGTWLSCEEYPTGQVWECDPLGVRTASVRPTLGSFTHEAVAVDPRRGHVYLTEDLPDGRWYRFTPTASEPGKRTDLDKGVLEVAAMSASDGQVTWHPIADPSGTTTPTRHQVVQSTAFKGGEGCWFANDHVYFTTKHDGRVWSFDVAQQRMTVLYDGRTRMNPVLTGVDNLTGSAAGDVLVAEDSGDMQVVALNAEGLATPIVQVVGHNLSEVTGPAFSPDGTRLYFSSQRGATGRSEDGMTFEVTGPFN